MKVRWFPYALLLAAPVLLLRGATRAEESRFITATLVSTEYLHYLDDTYHLQADLPTVDENGPRDDQVKISLFMAEIELTSKGVKEMPSIAVDYGGVKYVVSSHRLLVLGKRPTAHGFFMDTAPDPNGSGNVDVMITCNQQVEITAPGVELDCNRSPSGVSMSSRGGGGFYRGGERQWETTVTIRNDSGEPFILTKEYFKNLPEVKDWPVIEIPPLHPQV